MEPNHLNLPDSGFFTRNFTNDPRYPAGSYFESMGWRGYPHNTNIYGPDGSLLSQTDPGATLEAARNIVLNAWNNR